MTLLFKFVSSLLRNGNFVAVRFPKRVKVPRSMSLNLISSSSSPSLCQLRISSLSTLTSNQSSRYLQSENGTGTLRLQMSGTIIVTPMGHSGVKLRKTIFDEDIKKKPVKDEEDDEFTVKGDKIMKLNLNSNRLDTVLKAGLQISKNKIEKLFYGDRIRINGERPKKKSLVVREGDKIDLLRQPNVDNPAFIDISRIEILKLGEEADDDEDSLNVDSDDDDLRIPAVLKRYKRLTVENYKQKWKGHDE